MDALLQDLRFALRSFRRTPGVIAVIVLSLGLAIGANATVYTWMEALLFHPLPAVPQADRLVSVATATPDGEDWSLSYPAYLDWRASARGLEGIAVADFTQLSLRTTDQAERVWGLYISGNYFDVIQVRPVLGRAITPADETDRSPVAVISHSLWTRRFQGDSAVVGRHVALNGRDIEIIGVTPPRFGGTMAGLNFDLFTPVTLEPVLASRQWLNDRGNRWLDVVGRLRDGVSLAQAREDMNRVAAAVAEAHPEDPGRAASIEPLSDEGVQSILYPVFTALLGVTVLVLLIACFNVANLMLVRATARRKEISVRLAVGADRGRVVRQLLTESLLLALMAGGAGLAIAVWAKGLFLALVPATPFPVTTQLDINYRTFVFALAISLGTAIVFGLIPALRASRPDLLPGLKDESAATGSTRSRLRSSLVVAQVALSIVSLIAAGLFLRSLQKAQAVDPGIENPDQVLLVATDLSLAGYSDSAGAILAGRVLEQARALPGVKEASLASMVPLGFGGTSSSVFAIQDYEPAQDENMSIIINRVSSHYFETMGIPLVHGRGIAAVDRAGGAKVAVVNEEFAARYIRQPNPVGVLINGGGDDWITVVGIARNGKYGTLNEAPMPLVYLPIEQSWRDAFTLQVRTADEPTTLVEPLRRLFAQLDPGLPFLDPRTLAEHMGAALMANRIGGWLLSVFGLLALALSAIGIYSVVAYSVSRRVREIGLRVALGAGRREVMGLIVGHSMRLVLLGLLIGGVLGVGVGQLLRAQLFGISPGDPITFAAIGGLLIVVALAASWIPARRAARIEPLVALRSE
jgi:macrolide transport system ATP-binding/permease protein